MSDEPEDVPIIYGVFQDPLDDLRALREDILAMMDEDGEGVPSSWTGSIELRTSNRLHNTVVAFAAIAAAALENKSASLLITELVDDTYENSAVSAFFRDGSRINQHRREELLYRAGIIDGSLKHRMSEVRNPRNRLVHEVHGRFQFLSDREAAREYMDESIGTVERVEELVDEYWEGDS